MELNNWIRKLHNFRITAISPKMETIEMDSIECVSSSDGIEDEEIHSSHPHSSHHTNSAPFSVKPHSLVGSGLVPTNIHELLECPVCTNSMYPPIHQVRWIPPFLLSFHCRLLIAFFCASNRYFLCAKDNDSATWLFSGMLDYVVLYWNRFVGYLVRMAV